MCDSLVPIGFIKDKDGHYTFDPTTLEHYWKIKVEKKPKTSKKKKSNANEIKPS